MVEIIFQSKEDASKLYSRLYSFLNDNEILLYEEKQILKINVEAISEPIQTKISNVFYQFITKTKREDWLRKILAEHYYFEDFEEQQHILDIAYSILDGENIELAEYMGDNLETVEGSVKEAVNDLLQDTKIAFSFEAFVKFRLREYQAKLLKYAEISIDEYKMEQEYQMFIHTLREFLHCQEEKVELLHLVYEEEPIFYTEELTELKKSELSRMLDRKLLSNHPVYIDSITIAPLLSLAPKKIYLYTENIEKPIIRTIRNIFEERIIIKPLELFHDLKSNHMKKVSENW